MPLNKVQLTADLTQILAQPSTVDNAAQIAQQLADAIDAYVRTGNAVGVDSGGDAHTLTIS